MSILLDGARAGSGDALSTLQAVAALLLVAALLWLAGQLVRGRLRTRGRGLLVIEERMPLDPRNTLWIVKVEQRRLLLAGSDRGPARLLTELAPERPPELAPEELS